MNAITECRQFQVEDESIAAQCLWIVDDDESVRSLMAELLRKDGNIECSRQFSSAEAMLITLGREAAPDFILMDVNMGGMNGIDAISHVQTIAPETRVLIMTTFFDAKLASRARQAGAMGFFLKTDDLSNIAQSIKDGCLAEPNIPQVQPQLNWNDTQSRFEENTASSDGIAYSFRKSENRPDAKFMEPHPPFFARMLSFFRGLVNANPSSASWQAQFVSTERCARKANP
jgi:DNA-binding NarL/FixJ family response regulator